MNEIWVQALGFVGFAINLCAVSSVDDRRVRACICLSCLTFATHYALMGAIVASANLQINSFRALVSLKYSGKKVFWFFVVVQLVLSAALYSEPKDLLPMMASLISCYALFCAKGMTMRFTFLTCNVFWLLNSIVNGSYGGVVNDLFNNTILCITIFRLHRRNKLQQAATQA